MHECCPSAPHPKAEGKTEKETEMGDVMVSDISWAFAMTPALL